MRMRTSCSLLHRIKDDSDEKSDDIDSPIFVVVDGVERNAGGEGKREMEPCRPCPRQEGVTKPWACAWKGRQSAKKSSLLATSSMASDDGSKNKKSKREKQSKERSGSNMEVKPKEKKEKKKVCAFTLVLTI